MRRHSFQNLSQTNLYLYTFCPFLLPVGPIQSFVSFDKQIQCKNNSSSSVSFESLHLRFFVGFTKVFVLAPWLKTINFTDLSGITNSIWGPHLLFVGFVTCLYVYCSFSGWCDLILTAAKVNGFNFDENFDQPFASRNLKEHWNRWHMTFLRFMRELVFQPLLLFLMRNFKSVTVHICAPVCILLVFLLMGLWHGFAWNYFWFSLFHGVCLCFVYWYGELLKLTSSKFREFYFSSRIILITSWFLTIFAVSFGFILYSNSMADLTELWGKTYFF
ncbi:MAG: hypothetical protein IT287_05230 [Bdellovibrionaceae bacterium]|nr:hypothetical protein [Pseudobdellovibrionaceae bacterium]